MKIQLRFGTLLLAVLAAVAIAWSFLSSDRPPPLRRRDLAVDLNGDDHLQFPTVDADEHLEFAKSKPDRAIVIGRLAHEDTSWVQNDLPDFTPYIYTVNDPSAPGLHTVANKGREALAYLTYLVTNYHNLASTIVFLHSHKAGFPRAWHVDTPEYSNVEAMQMLNLSYVQRTGYVNLRCNPNVGCPDEIVLDRATKDPDLVAELEMPAAWRALMGADSEPPAVIAQACCAQFAVSRPQVLKRPLRDYQRYYRWLLETPLPDEISGRIFEYLWHIVFGQDAVFCPEQEFCYCHVYNACSMYDGPRL